MSPVNPPFVYTNSFLHPQSMNLYFKQFRAKHGSEWEDLLIQGPSQDPRVPRLRGLDSFGRQVPPSC